jgi:hypothetical protein
MVKHTCIATVAATPPPPCAACEWEFISAGGFVPQGEELRGTSIDVPSSSAEVGIHLADVGPCLRSSGGQS